MSSGPRETRFRIHIPIALKKSGRCQVFVPLAHRLGMWYFKTELEQRCFALSLPREYHYLSKQAAKAHLDVVLCRECKVVD